MTHHLSQIAEKMCDMLATGESLKDMELIGKEPILETTTGKIVTKAKDSKRRILPTSVLRFNSSSW